MNHKLWGSFLTLIILTFLHSCDFFDNDPGVPINEDIWVNAYLVSWQHNPETELINSGDMTTNDIDWNAFTHLTYFTLSIAGNGLPLLNLDPAMRHNFNSDRLRDIVPAAHAHNTKILFSVGGSTNYVGFSTAIDTSKARFVQTISSLITEYGFDGVSLNMIPIEPKDYTNFTEFVNLLSSTFDTLRTSHNRRPLLIASTTSASAMSSFFKNIQQHFDQINILTYEMARPWRGWITWHNAAMFNNSLILENTTQYLPSIHEKVNEWITAGIDRSKLGITISFYGAIWEDVNIEEKWASWPTENQSIYHTNPYNVMRNTYDLEAFLWDEKARAAYLDLKNPKAFVSFENEKSISVKMNYVKNNRLGGVLLWDISSGFSESESPKNPLLDAVKTHISKPSY